MKIWYKFFAVIVAMALVTGCSKDDLGDDDITPGGSKDVAYMSVSVARLRPKARAVLQVRAEAAAAVRKPVRTGKTTCARYCWCSPMRMIRTERTA